MAFTWIPTLMGMKGIYLYHFLDNQCNCDLMISGSWKRVKRRMIAPMWQKLVVLFFVFLKTVTVAIGCDYVWIDLEMVQDDLPVGVVEELVLFTLCIDIIFYIFDWLLVMNEIIFTCARVFFLKPFNINGAICGG